MDRSHILKIALFIEIVALVVNAVAISRDYQDSWVLEGLEIPFTIFLITYAIVFFSEKSVKRTVILAAICSSVFVLIPNLKYVWFLGRNVDQHVQFSLANYAYNEGHLISDLYWREGTAVGFYATTPLIHLSLVSFSKISGIPILFSFKFLPVILSSMYPLLVYVMIKKLGITEEKTVLRYALFVSSLPIDSALSYIFTGSMFGVLFTFFALLQIVKLSRKSNRSDLLLLIVFSCALVMLHSFSALLLPLLILGVISMQKLYPLRLESYPRISAIFLILLLNLGWLIFQAPGTLGFMIERISNVAIVSGAYATEGAVSLRFLELVHASVLEAFKTILAINGADIFLMLLMIASLILAAKNRKSSNRSKFLFLLNVLLWILLVVGVLSGLAAYYWKRIVRLISITYGIFFGILVVHINQSIEQRKTRSVFVLSLLLLAMILAPIEVYRYQPIVSPANVLSRDLPGDEPIVYLGQVNSIYQREMIGFAEEYVRGSIACDGVTTNQIVGLTEIDFSGALIWFYPFSTLLYENLPEREYDYFLIHLPGKSGAFEEKAEIRTASLIRGALNSSIHSVAYSNSESYILVHLKNQDD